MRSALDFTSWQSLALTLFGVALASLVAIGVRLVFMQSLQRRRERENRQINERLRTLIAAYKTLGGSFTGDLTVDPTHRRELMAEDDAASASGHPANGSDRRRRVRDAVEAALSDVILLGTEAQVRLAVRAAEAMAGGRRVETAELVVSLRDFVRHALDLEAVPVDLAVPRQGPSRQTAGGARQANRQAGRGGAGGGAGRSGASGAADEPHEA